MSGIQQPVNYRCLSLAATVESVFEMQLAAVGRRFGPIDHLIDPLLVTEPDSLEAVFPAPHKFGRGVQAARLTLMGQSGTLPIFTYWWKAVGQSDLLARRPGLATKLGEQLSTLADEPRTNDFYLALDEIYQQTLGTLERRINVRGKRSALTDPDTAARIRALLLAAVRFAWLWRQLGGKRWLLPLRLPLQVFELNRLARQIT